MLCSSKIHAKAVRRGALFAQTAVLLLAMVSGYVRTTEENKVSVSDAWAEDAVVLKAEGTVYRIGKNSYSFQIYLKDVLLIAESGEQISCRQLLVYVPSNPQLKLGNRIQISGTLQAFAMPSNPGEFHTYHYYRALGFSYQLSGKQMQVIKGDVAPVWQALYEYKESAKLVLSKVTSDLDYGVYAAMLLGEKAELDEELKTLYEENGIAHILAISGLHISLLGMTLYRLLRKVFRFWVSGMVSGGVMFLYVLMTGMSVSAVRAWMMFFVMLFAACIGRCYDMNSAAACSALYLLWNYPYLIFYAGFLLSFGAVLGIGVLAKLMSDFIHAKHPLVKACLGSLAVQWMTLPVTAYFFFSYSPYSLILNLAVIPCMSFVVSSGMLAMLLGSVSSVLGSLSAGMGHYILELYRLLCRICEGLPGKNMLLGRPAPAQAAIYYGLLAILIGVMTVVCKGEKGKKTTRENRTRRALGILFFSAVLTGILFWNHHEGLSVTYLDVSQGDGICIRTPSGNAYLIDGGSSDVKKVGEYRMIPYLHANQIGRITYAVVTHADTDHCSGVKTLLESGEVSIQTLLLPKLSLPDEAYRSLEELALAAGTKVMYLEEGMCIQDGEVKIFCLYPYAGFDSADRNAGSVVLHMNYGEVDFLFTGDMDESAENYLLRKDVPDCEILKVAHHGSRYSSTERFLARLLPEYAVISCGERNSYGHPHQEVLDRLQSVGAQIYVTEECGAITVTTDGKDIRIDSHLRKNMLYWAEKMSGK